MTILKKKKLKIILMLVVTSLLFLIMNWTGYYVTYTRNPNSLLGFIYYRWYVNALSISICFLETLVAYTLTFKLAKYIGFKIWKYKYKYLVTFIACYIEVTFWFAILHFHLTDRYMQLSPRICINIALYSIVFVLSDYLFSKIYKNFNTLRVALLNASCNILAMVSMQIFLIHFR